jgi:glutamate-1-semialdehyde aminotransferase
LNALVPGDGPRKTLLVNTGAEAVENAVKIARAATGRPAVVAFEHAFHGRTLLGLTLPGGGGGRGCGDDQPILEDVAPAREASVAREDIGPHSYGRLTSCRQRLAPIRSMGGSRSRRAQEPGTVKGELDLRWLRTGG